VKREDKSEIRNPKSETNPNGKNEKRKREDGVMVMREKRSAPSEEKNHG